MKDLIIDAFAGGGGASVGIEMALGRPVDIAINHDPDAILMHKTNHPDTLHLTEDIFKVNLKKYVKGQHVALMWASPDCTSHSKAKGGKPREKGLRILPWAVYKMDGKSDGQSKLTVLTALALRSGNLVEITLTGQILAVRYLTARSHLQKLHRRELQTASRNILSMQNLLIS